MKKALKIFSYTFLIILLLIISLLVIADFSQNRIAAMALSEVSKIIKAPVEIKHVSFSLIKRFPLATIELSGVRLGAENDSNKTKNDDIVTIKNLLVSVKTLPLLDNQIEIIKVEVEGADIRYHVDTTGRANIDFLIPPTDSTTVEPVDTTSTPMPKIDLKKFRLENIALYYKDDTANIAASLRIPELEASGKIFDGNYLGNVQGDMRLTDVNVSGTNAKKLKELSLNFGINYEQDTLFVQKVELQTEGAHFSADGKAAVQKDIFADINFQTKGINLEQLLKYAPEAQLKEFGVEDLKGLLTFSGKVKGMVTDTTTLPYVSVDVEFKNGYAKTKDYPTVEALSFDGNFSNGKLRNNRTTSATFRNIHVATKQSSVNANVAVSNIDQPKYNVDSEVHVILEEFKNFIPKDLIKSLNGKVDAKLSTKGQLKGEINDAFINKALNSSYADIKCTDINVEMDSLEVKDFNTEVSYKPGRFIVKNTKVDIPTYQTGIKNTSLDAELKGQLTNPKKLAVFVKAFHVETPQASMEGKASVMNLEHPDFMVDASAQLHLDKLKPFLPDSIVKKIGGEINAHVNSYGKLNLDSIETQAMEIAFKQTRLKVDFSNIAVALPDAPSMHVEKISGAVHMVPDTISVPSLSGVAAGIPFNFLSTKIINVYKTALLNQKDTLRVLGDWRVGDMDHTLFDPLLDMMASLNDTTSQTTETVVDTTAVASAEPQNFALDIKGKFAVKSFRYDMVFIDKMTDFLQWPDSDAVFFKSMLRDKILVDDISGKFRIQDSTYTVDQFKFNAFKGSANNSFKMKFLPGGKQEIYSRNTITDMDMKQVLYDTNSGGQMDLITYENLGGTATATFNTMIEMKDSTEFSMENMRMRGEMKLENGGVYNYEPAMAMEKAPGTKDMSNIKFKTLESKIFIFNGKAWIPNTYIVTSEKDVTFYGMYDLHDGVENYEYHAFLQAGQLASTKSKRKRKEALANEDVSEKDKSKRMTHFIYKQDKNMKTTAGIVITKKGKREGRMLKSRIRANDKTLGFRFRYILSYETGVK